MKNTKLILLGAYLSAFADPSASENTKSAEKSSSIKFKHGALLTGGLSYKVTQLSDLVRFNVFVSFVYSPNSFSKEGFTKDFNWFVFLGGQFAIAQYLNFMFGPAFNRSGINLMGAVVIGYSYAINENVSVFGGVGYQGNITALEFGKANEEKTTEAANANAEPKTEAQIITQAQNIAQADTTKLTPDQIAAQTQVIADQNTLQHTTDPKVKEHVLSRMKKSITKFFQTKFRKKPTTDTTSKPTTDTTTDATSKPTTTKKKFF